MTRMGAHREFGFVNVAVKNYEWAIRLLASSLMVEIRDGRRRAAATATSLAQARRRLATEVAIGLVG